MTTPAVAIERDEVSPTVAIVALDRPDVLNVFSGGMGAELSAAFRDLDADDSVRVIVLTGRGRAFCAGADMTPQAASFGAPSQEFSAQPMQTPPYTLSKPVIAAIQGHAIGIGFTITLQCDLRIVAEDAKLAIPQARRGVLGDAGSHWTLRRITSQAVAADVLLTGRTFRGTEAAALGIANRAVPADQVLPTALGIARDMAAAGAPASLALSKRLLWADAGLEETIRRETEYHRIVMGTPDAAEGPRAWMERRDPQWTLQPGDVREAADRIDAGGNA